MRIPLVLGLLILLVPASAQAARFEQAPQSVTAPAPVTFTLAADGQSVSSGVAYKLSTEQTWHRCLAPGPITLNLPPGGYRLDIADDTSRPWFDAHVPTSLTPECSETGAPWNRDVTSTFFSVRFPPPAPAPVDTCGPELGRVDRLQNRAEGLLIRYEHRRTKARRRAWKKAHDSYVKAWRSYRKRC